jgi:phosphate transport system protein
MDEPMVYTPHLDRVYERELTHISTELSRMADKAERMVRAVVDALLSGDVSAAARIQGEDNELDEMEVHIDQLCVHLMARRAPVGADLRMVTSALKLVTDIERIGDLAVNIAKRLPQVGGVAIPEEVTQLASTALGELALAFRCLRERDAVTARSLRDEDKSTDACNRAAFDRLIRLGTEQPQAFAGILSVTNVCRHLERIGDHAVNISEMVVYMVDGKVLRHRPV